VAEEPGGLEAWVGSAVYVLLTGEREHWVGVLQDWDIRFRASEGEAPEEGGPDKPMLVLFPWAQVRHVGVFLDDL
jgi:hypothetical protein